MSSELEVLKQRITELEAGNVEIAELRKENAELRKENTEISYLRNKLSVSDAEIAELKRRNIEFLRANKEYNERRDAKVKKLEQKNKELETRLAIVEQNSVAVGGRVIVYSILIILYYLHICHLISSGGVTVTCKNCAHTRFAFINPD
jgi:uncharacterized membrane protein (DUF106 family)